MSASATLCTLLGICAATVGGVFLSFSDFVMRGLAGAAPPSGIESMQSINRSVYRSLFLTAFAALVPASVLLTVWQLIGGHDAVATGFILLGALIYLGGVFAATALVNVPLNHALAALEVHTSQAREFWPTYRRRWLRWNHLRTGAALGAALCWLLAAARLSAT